MGFTGINWSVQKHVRTVARLRTIGIGPAEPSPAVGSAQGSTAPAATDAGTVRIFRSAAQPADTHRIPAPGLPHAGHRGDIIGFGDAGVWTALSNGDGTFTAPTTTQPRRSAEMIKHPDSSNHRRAPARVAPGRLPPRDTRAGGLEAPLSPAQFPSQSLEGS
jgi:hypothetical protein